MLWRTLAVIAALILNILFSRYYAASGSGNVFYIFTIFTLITQVAGFSLESGTGYYTAKGGGKENVLFTLSFVWSVVSSGIALGFLLLIGATTNSNTDYPFSYPLAYILGNMLISFGNAFSYAKYKFVLPGFLAVVVNTVLILVLVAMNSGGWKEHFISFYFYSFLVHGVLLFALISITQKMVPSLQISRAALKNIFRYSSFAFIANLLFLLISRLDYFFVKQYCTANELGNYIQVSRIAQVFFIIPSMIASVLFPVIAGGLRGAVADRIKTLSILILIVYVVPLGMLAVAGKWIFPWLFGESFGQMYLPYLLLIPGILAISSLYPYTAYFSAHNRIGVNIKGSLLALVVILTGDLIFIPKYGIYAAALVSSAGYMVFQGYVFTSFAKEFNSSLKKLFTLNRREILDIIASIKR